MKSIVLLRMEVYWLGNPIHCQTMVKIHTWRRKWMTVHQTLDCCSDRPDFSGGNSVMTRMAEGIDSAKVVVFVNRVESMRRIPVK
jgi:hypothetical protein